MEITLVRHAKAGQPDTHQWPDDSQRPLTKKGTRQFKKAAQGIGKLAKPDVVLTSPMARTMQTAQLLNWDADWPAPVAHDVLDDGHSPAEVVKTIRNLDGKPQHVGIVGHGPNLAELANYLTNHTDNDDGIHLNKGGAASIEMPRRSMKAGTGRLKWAMRRQELMDQ